ncbi:MAG TPA: hypothetical protein VHM90_13970 [Phycisphaerae bacterium]|nr:hypothetical protein [Phycisphaerae bacterium]
MPANDNVLSAPAALPDGYFPVGFFPAAAGPVRVNLVVRKAPDTVAGHFVILRTLLDGIVYLGCLTDAGNRVHGYVEIWCQSLDGLAGSPAAAREALTNKTLDERWAKLFKAYDALDADTPSAVIRTGFETVHPQPLFYDPDKKETLNPIDGFSNAPWKLCTDDALLVSKGLPAYSTSLHRYLCADAKSPLIPVTPDAPIPPGAPPSTAPLTEITGPKNALKMIHAGGLLLIRKYSPVALEPLFDLLSGGTWDGILAGRSAVHLNKLNEVLEEKSGTEMADGRLFLGKHGKWGRLVETFHLKLRLLADAMEHVRLFTAQTQRPLLNITAQSFQVDVGSSHAHALPFLWTAAATLVDPGDAVTLKIEGAEAQYFVRGVSAPGNVFQPESVSKPASGRGILRIRKTMAETSGIILEGTFSTHDRLGSGGSAGETAAEPTRNDLIWLRVPIGSQRIDLFGHIEKDSALARGEWRFRTERQRLPEALVAQVKAAEGAPIPETLFEVIPLLASPCDMYSLAVLAARALLVDADTTLAIATDELISLARQVSLQAKADQRLGARIETIFSSDSRWLNSLGPHRLTRETISPQEAFDLVPANLWFDTLGLLVQMLPGIGPDSFCRDYGDAPRGGLHKIYEEAQNTLDTLLVRTRSLIVIDWRFNREIHAVLRRF